MEVFFKNCSILLVISVIALNFVCKVQTKPSESNLNAMEIDYYADARKIVEVLQRNQEKKMNDEEQDQQGESIYIPNKFIVYVKERREFDNNSEPTEGRSPSLDSWSVVWYIASFGGLIAFFLVVSCSEWCCRRNARNNCTRNAVLPTQATTSDSPPPSYDQFAPPSYESCTEKSEFDVYVVPVHAFSTIIVGGVDDAPPSYVSASTGGFCPAYPATPPPPMRELQLNPATIVREHSQ